MASLKVMYMAPTTPVLKKEKSRWTIVSCDSFGDDQKKVTGMCFRGPAKMIDSIFKLHTNKLEFLRELNLGCCSLTKISPSIMKLKHLTHINLSGNKLSTIPLAAVKLEKLLDLDLSENKFKNFPPAVCKLTNLKVLTMSNNMLKCLPSEICNLVNLQCFNMEDNHLEGLPYTFGMLTNLESLHLSDNSITQLPQSFGNLSRLIDLDIRENQLTELPRSIGNLTNLEQIYLDDNELKTLPTELMKCESLHTIDCMGNQDMELPVNLRRFIDGIDDAKFGDFDDDDNSDAEYDEETQTIYHDKQNVHDTTIQQSFRTSVLNLTNDKITETVSIDDILCDSALTTHTKEAITEYCSNDDIYEPLQLTFEELLMYVWNRIKHSDELKKRLNEEIAGADCKCFTGRMIRIVNTLSGYFDDIVIKISDSSQISSIILLIRKKMAVYDKDEHIRLAKQQLTELGYPMDVIDVWIEHIE